jgi:hypothetical protein
MSQTVAAGAVFAFVIAGVATGSWAQGLVSMQKLSAPLANELVGDTVAICAQRGYTVTAVVVDLDGVRQALLRGNGAPIHTLDNAFFKGVLGGLADAGAQGGQHQGRRRADGQESRDHGAADAAPQRHVCGRRRDDPGGRRADRGDRRERGPGGQLDDDCARAAIAKIQDRMK